MKHSVSHPEGTSNIRRCSRWARGCWDRRSRACRLLRGRRRKTTRGGTRAERRERERACDELTQAARRVGEMPPGQRRQGAAALWVAPPHLPARPRERRPFYVLWCVPWCVFHVRAHVACA